MSIRSKIECIIIFSSAAFVHDRAPRNTHKIGDPLDGTAQTVLERLTSAMLKSASQRTYRRIDLRLAFWVCTLVVGCFQLTLVTLYDSSSNDHNGEIVYLLDAPPPRPAKRELKWKQAPKLREGIRVKQSTQTKVKSDISKRNKLEVEALAFTSAGKHAKPGNRKIHDKQKRKKLTKASTAEPKQEGSTIDIELQLKAIQKAGKLYSIGRKDRSGSVITDQLFAHAFAFAHNVEYAGACFPVKGLPKKDTRSLLSQLRWDSYLKFGCPKGEGILHDPKAASSPLVLSADIYRHKLKESYFTEAWRNEIQRLLPRDDEMASKKVFEIAVHVRRGDVTPCRYKRRYLPNDHYLELIDRYLPKDREAHVTIFSESDSFELFDDFRVRGFDVRLDTELASVWEALATAEVTILSRSYFSFVPAAVNPNKVVYTQFFEFDPLESWDLADEDLVRRSDKRIREMYNTRCNATAIELERQLQDQKHGA